MTKPRWDPVKAEANWRKHGVRFEEAMTVFEDTDALFRDDLTHSDEEDRYLLTGRSEARRILTVIYTIRHDQSWIISARRATGKESRAYIMKTDMICDRPLDDDDDKGINFDDIPPQDMSNAVRGLHTLSRTVVKTVGLYEDVAEYFPNEKAVNRALREVIAVGNAPAQRGY